MSRLNRLEAGVTQGEITLYLQRATAKYKTTFILKNAFDSAPFKKVHALFRVKQGLLRCLD